MNAWTGALGCWLLLGILVPAHGQSHAELRTAEDLKAALNDVLTHNDLFDADYLSDTFGIGLRISRLEIPDRDTTSYEGTATANPPALYGSIHYEADAERAGQTSTARLSFGSRACESLRLWGNEWHVQAKGELSTDGGPYIESLVWPASDGITLTLTAFSSGCNVSLSQTVKRLVNIPVSPALPLAPATGLSGQIGGLLLSDLRDYAQIGRILDTEFVVEPDLQRNGLLYHGSLGPDRVIRGFKSNFLYYGDDSGWYMPAGFIARPLHITDRTVELNLTADKDVVCLSSEQLASELERRDQRIHRQRGDSRNQSVYLVRGLNLVSVAVTFNGDCATELRFHQVTDVSHSLGAPIRFTTAASLDRSKHSLTGGAQRKIRLLAFRLRSVSLAGIQIEEMSGEQSTVEVGQELALIKRLIIVALKQNGIAVPRSATNEESGECYLRLQNDEPSVCVDVWH